MPYIVTTKAPTEPDAYGRFKDAQADGRIGPLSRRAVATLDQARAYASEQVVQRSYRADDFNARAWGDLEQSAIDIAEHGGTIGPLPDGTVIEVEQVREAALYNAIRPSLCCPTCGIQRSHVSGSHLIDAYNAVQEN